MSDEKCRFMQDDGWCMILGLGRPCGDKLARCTFRRTEKQYNEERDRAIDLCRQKGQCDKCKYTPITRRCSKSAEG